MNCALSNRFSSVSAILVLLVGKARDPNRQYIVGLIDG